VTSGWSQETELESAKWMPMAEYAEQQFQRGVPLYEKIRERCVLSSHKHFSLFTYTHKHTQLP
jgi:hypothetical protein